MMAHRAAAKGIASVLVIFEVIDRVVFSPVVWRAAQLDSRECGIGFDINHIYEGQYDVTR